MITKLDLIKEFEILTKQQIKEHNDLLLSTNQRLQKTELQLQNLLRKISDVDAKERSDILKVCMDSTKQSGFIKEFIVKVDSRINDEEQSTIKMQEFLKSFEHGIVDMINALDSKTIRLISESNLRTEGISKTTIAERIERLSSTQSMIKDQKALNDALKCEIDDLRRLLLSYDEKLQKKQQVQDEMSAGYVREIAVCKKAIHVSEKKIENLDTQIKRLKGVGY